MVRPPEVVWLITQTHTIQLGDARAVRGIACVEAQRHAHHVEPQRSRHAVQQRVDARARARRQQHRRVELRGYPRGGSGIDGIHLVVDLDDLHILGSHLGQDAADGRHLAVALGTGWRR